VKFYVSEEKALHNSACCDHQH